jgi:hypothetical protein
MKQCQCNVNQLDELTKRRGQQSAGALSGVQNRERQIPTHRIKNEWQSEDPNHANIEVFPFGQFLANKKTCICMYR